MFTAGQPERSNGKMKKKITASLLIIISIAFIFLSTMVETMSTVHLPSEDGECNHSYKISCGLPAYATMEPNRETEAMEIRLHFANILLLFTAFGIPIFFAGYIIGKTKK